MKKLDSVTLADLQRVTQFTSFTDAYSWLKKMKKLDSFYLTIPERQVKVFNQTMTVEAEMLSIQDIRNKALEEIYSTLPTEDEVEKIVSCLMESAAPFWHSNECIDIVKRIQKTGKWQQKR